MNYKERELREKRARKATKMASFAAKLEDGNITSAERAEFDKLSREVHDLDRRIQLAQFDGGAQPEFRNGVSNMGAYVMNGEAVNQARGLRSRIARDTSDLPTPDKPMEARHDMRAWYEQRKDYSNWSDKPKVTDDWGSFDKDAFYWAMLTGNTNSREYRAMAEGSQSFSVTGGTGGYVTPIQFSMDILPLLRAALLFTSPEADGSIGGVTVYPMESAMETVPSWSSDGTGMATWLQENTQMTPVTPALGLGVLTAKTMACTVLSSRQLLEDAGNSAGIAATIESNIAMAMARGIDQAALWGTGPTNYQPAGLLTNGGAYQGVRQEISMGTNGAALSASGSHGWYGPVAQAIQKCKTSQDPGPFQIYTNPLTASYLQSGGLSTLNTYIDPPSDVRPYLPIRESTVYPSTETWGTASTASTISVLNPNRVIMGLRAGIGFQILTERWSDYLQTGFLAWLRLDFLYPYAAQTCHVRGVLSS
jgi:HK97 family phage major capsid protein